MRYNNFMKKLFDYDLVEVKKIMDQMKKHEDLLYQSRKQQLNAQTGAQTHYYPPQFSPPAKNILTILAQCFHCGAGLDRLNTVYYEIVKYDNGHTRTTKTFHESCFEEVAGKGDIE